MRRLVLCLAVMQSSDLISKSAKIVVCFRLYAEQLLRTVDQG